MLNYETIIETINNMTDAGEAIEACSHIVDALTPQQRLALARKIYRENYVTDGKGGEWTDSDIGGAEQWLFSDIGVWMMLDYCRMSDKDDHEKGRPADAYKTREGTLIEAMVKAMREMDSFQGLIWEGFDLDLKTKE
jgi:hypothetical protein